MLYTKNFILLALIMFLASATFMLLMPILPLFALNVIKLPEAEIGLMVGAFSVAAFCVRPFLGYLIDSYDKRRIFVISMALFTAVVISYGFISTLAMLLVVRMLHGGSWASASTAVSTIVVDIIPPKRRAEGIGAFSLAMPLAMVIGPAAGVELYMRSGFGVTFAAASVTCVIALGLCFLLRLPPRPNVPRQKLKLSPAGLYEMRAMGISAMQFCYSFAYAGVATFLPIYATKNGVGNFSYFFVFYACTVLASRILVRKTFDLRGPSPMIYMGYTGFAIGAFIMGLTHSAGFLYLAGLFCGLGGGMIMPSLNTMSMNIVEPMNRGKATATVMTAIDVGMGVGAMVLGVIAQHTSYSVMYFTVTASLVLSMLWYRFYEKKHYLHNIERMATKLNEG
ncbi:MAG: MFS transporter [Deferribacteraceae bacterium]|nr:MFS transporter [Deferribacteraceae bacterium]